MLNSNTLSYSPYHDHRFDTRSYFIWGRSGPLMIGTDKRTGKKYLIKYTYPHNAANEYAACWLAEKIGVAAPHAELLMSCKRFPHAVAIEFIDGLQKLPETLTETMKVDVCRLYALNTLIANNDDGIQMSMANGRIYTYDFSESFCSSDDQLIKACESNENTAVASMRDHLSHFRSTSLFGFSYPDMAKNIGMESDQQIQISAETGRRVLDITKDEIADMSDEIYDAYNEYVAVYYQCCIEEMQKKVTRFFDSRR